jgi:hypothetical protein
MFRYAIGAAALAFATLPMDPAGAQRVRAGVLTCDISAGVGFIVGSQKSLSCTFAPEPPGAQHVYSGSISKFGLDIGATGGGVMVWAVFTDSIAAPRPRISRRRLFRRDWPSDGRCGAPTCSLAVPIAPSRCSRFRSTARSGSISPSEWRNCICAPAPDGEDRHFFDA